MILKGSQRGGARALARHLLNKEDNDHIHVQQVRGVMSDDLEGALTEMEAVATATKARQPLFSLSLNPPEGASVTMLSFIEAADKAEEALGLTGQPRIIITHEKQGRRHAHVVWSRIDAAEMKAINMSYFKTKLNKVAKELFLDHGWNLPDGFKENGWANPLNFSLDQWQQAKRLGLDPRELKMFFRDAWAKSDDFRSFRAALEAGGYYLAKGNKRSYVAMDLNGKVFSVSRMTGVHPYDLGRRLGPASKLPNLDKTRQRIRTKSARVLKAQFKALGAYANGDLTPLLVERQAMMLDQRDARKFQQEMQAKRWEQEQRDRLARFRKGVRGLIDVLTGRARAIRGQNNQAILEAQMRDLEEREKLIGEQLRARQLLQTHIAAAKNRARERREEFVRERAALLRWHRSPYLGRSMARRNDETELDHHYGMTR